MQAPDLFWTIFAAVLGGNILTAMFVWGAVSYTRLEKVGREKEDGGAYLAFMLMPLAALGLAGFITLY